MSKRFFIILFFVLILLISTVSAQYDFEYVIWVTLNSSTDIPNGDNELFHFGLSSSDESEICSYKQLGLHFAVWFSDVSEGDVTGVFLPGDADYGFEYIGDLFGLGLGYFGFYNENFKNAARSEQRLFELNSDTLHIRLSYDMLETRYVWALDTVITDVTDYVVEIYADMEPCPHSRWDGRYYPCFCSEGVQEPDNTAPTDYVIAHNLPNPFNSATEIDYSIPEHANVTLDVYDINARYIKGLVNDNLNSGRYSVKWDGTDESGNTVPSGTYLYKIKAGDYEAERKMLFVK